jgi:phospholipid/cholesterol/gamma-HCH transport system substrate-binding protein
MEAKREQTLVGLFVLIAAGLLLGTVAAITGTFTRRGVSHHVYFKFAGGLQAGAAVRYGGMRAGHVERVQVDPEDSTRIEVDFTVRPDVPVKTDSVVKISSLSALGDNYLEITTGSKDSPLAPPGSMLKSAELVGFAELTESLNALVPTAQQALLTINQRLNDLQVTIARVNDLLNDKNRAHVSSTLASLDGMLAEDRPKLSATLTNLQDVSAKAAPLLDDFKKTVGRADEALAHVDSMVLENREDVHKAVLELRQTLQAASATVDQLNRTLDTNSDSIDQTLENIRVTTENLRELTDEVKQRPYVLVRGSRVKERQPGEVGGSK